MTLPSYKPPTISTQRAAVYSIPIVLEAVPPANMCEVTGIIDFPFRITKIAFGCTDATPTEADYYFFVSDNDNTPTNAPPPDENILAPFAPQGFARCPAGSAVLPSAAAGYVLDTNYEVSEVNKRLKVFIRWVFGAGRRHQVVFTVERMS